MRAFGHAQRLSAANRHDIALDCVHAVVNGKATRNHATRAIDEENNVIMIQGIQIQELLHNAFGTFVIDTTPQENSALGGEVFFRLLEHVRGLLFFVFVTICHK